MIGTGGANLKRSTGHGTLVYAMRVDEKLTRKQYYLDERFARKKPAGGPYAQMQDDNVQPNGTFEQHGQYSVTSEKSPNYRPTTRCIAAPLETCSFTL